MEQAWRRAHSSPDNSHQSAGRSWMCLLGSFFPALIRKREEQWHLIAVLSFRSKTRLYLSSLLFSYQVLRNLLKLVNNAQAWRQGEGPAFQCRNRWEQLQQISKVIQKKSKNIWQLSQLFWKPMRKSQPDNNLLAAKPRRLQVCFSLTRSHWTSKLNFWGGNLKKIRMGWVFTCNIPSNYSFLLIRTKWLFPELPWATSSQKQTLPAAGLRAPRSAAERKAAQASPHTSMGH